MQSPHEELNRALAFIARVDEGAATEVREWRLGAALITPELPRVWDASYFRVEDPGDGDGERIADETTSIARDAGLAHAALVFTDDEVVARFRPGLESAGFEEARFVLMALREVPEAPEAEITEVSFDDVAPSRRELTLEMFTGDEALADQLHERDRRLDSTIGGRWFAIRDARGIVSRAWLLQADGVGQVEDVATTRSHREKGLARSVVSTAARASSAAGNDLTFVIADDGATTPQLYRKTGFEPMGYRWRFVKRLRPATAGR
ncbi:MAG: GNAT family N-acetyltransferase [Solirubrobacterales bacterium]